MNKFLSRFNKGDEPLVRVVKRADIPWWKSALLFLGAIFLALVIGSIFIAAIGKNPFKFFEEVFVGSFSNTLRIKGVISIFVPLTIISLGIALAFKMKFWNIGAEGQFMMGAFGAFTMAIAIGDKLPAGFSTFVVVILGAVIGGLYGLIVAVFKVRFNTNETLLTLMFNYIATALVTYCVYFTYFKKPSNGIPEYKKIAENSWLIAFSDANGIEIIDFALIIALVLIVVLFIYFKYTKQGYEISVVGDSPNTARYAGMNVKKVTLRTVFLSAMLIGLAGSLQLTGIASNHTMAAGISGGLGWTGIIVAWLARLNPIGIGIGSFLMAMLEAGSSNARSALEISSAVAEIVQGILLFCVLASDFFIRFKIVFRKGLFTRKAKIETVGCGDPSALPADPTLDAKAEEN